MLEEANTLINDQLSADAPEDARNIARQLAQAKIQACLYDGALSTTYRLIKSDLGDECSQLAQNSLSKYLKDAYSFPAATANMEREAVRAAQEAALKLAITHLESSIDLNFIDRIADLLVEPVHKYLAGQYTENSPPINILSDSVPDCRPFSLTAECRRKAQLKTLELIDIYLCANHSEKIRQTARESLTAKLECIAQETTIMTLSDEMHRRTRTAAEMAARGVAQQFTEGDLYKACFLAARKAVQDEFNNTFDSLLSAESHHFISAADKQLLLDTSIKLAESIAQDAVDRKLLATTAQNGTPQQPEHSNDSILLILIALGSLLGILVVWFATPIGTGYLKPILNKTFSPRIYDQLYLNPTNQPASNYNN